MNTLGKMKESPGFDVFSESQAKSTWFQQAFLLHLTLLPLPLLHPLPPLLLFLILPQLLPLVCFGGRSCSPTGGPVKGTAGNQLGSSASGKTTHLFYENMKIHIICCTIFGYLKTLI